MRATVDVEVAVVLDGREERGDCRRRLDRGGDVGVVDVATEHDALVGIAGGALQRRDLPRRALGIGSVRIGHRLDDNRGTAADNHTADINGVGLASFGGVRQHISACSCS